MFIVHKRKVTLKYLKLIQFEYLTTNAGNYIESTFSILLLYKRPFKKFIGYKLEIIFKFTMYEQNKINLKLNFGLLP